MMVIGIDASNISSGGGLNHLVEFLSKSNPVKHGFKKIIVWAPQSTLDAICDRSWIVKYTYTVLEKNFIFRALWQWNELGILAKTEGCTILFVPGGSFFTNYRPIVTMSQNLLPFEWSEVSQYGLSLFTFKLLLLRSLQSYSFRNSNGVVFLTKYAKRKVISKIGGLNSSSIIIHHGIDKKFYYEPRCQRLISSYNKNKPFRFIYVSPLEPYKHHNNVINAVNIIRKKGYPIILDMYGSPSRGFVKNRLIKLMKQYDPKSEFIKYHGIASHNDIQNKYYNADAAIFASSCEAFGQILTECMASGLPIICSSKSSVQELLGDNGEYFNPYDPNSIARSLEKVLKSVDSRDKYALGGYKLSKNFSWEKCADKTFSFLRKINDKYRVNNV